VAAEYVPISFSLPPWFPPITGATESLVKELKDCRLRMASCRLMAGDQDLGDGLSVGYCYLLFAILPF
jgi:hypothetical protein